MADPGSTRRLDSDDERLGLARHGIAGPRGQSARAVGGGGRFGRMFGQLPEADLDAEALDALIDAVTAVAGGSDGSIDVPAGYTYLAQFVDHDVTFDPNSRLDAANDPYTLADFRTPRLDLDSVYGSGPMDQPFLYDWRDERPNPGVRLLVDEPESPRLARFDLPRNRDGRALIGDARNDENLIVSQLHTLFLRFHNRVVEELRPQYGGRSAALFEHAQRLVRWHYQWIVLHDLLPTLVGARLMGSLLAEPEGALPVITRRVFEWREQPFMPVEFSAGAYRFGHSLVRDDYRVRDGVLNVPIMVNDRRDPFQLGGFRRVPDELEIEWKHFFRLDGGAPPQDTMRIDASVALALTDLFPDGKNLVFLNLRRGRALGLPSGRDVALAMGEKPLADEQLVPAPIELGDAVASAVVKAPPLWYYVLCEARARGAGVRLGPVGGRIVAEVLVGLVQGDPASYLSQNPLWRPELRLRGGNAVESIADLINYVQEADGT
jgi:Animal haem peroxidase